MFAFFRHRPNFRRLLIAMFALPLMFAGGSLVGGLDPSIGGVGSLEISRNEFYGAYQQLEEAYRRRYGLEEIPPELGAQLVQETRSRLLSEYLMRASAEDKHLRAPDAAVAAEIRRMDDFLDEDGNFSMALFQEFVPDIRRLEREVRLALNRRPLLRALEPFAVTPVEERLAAFRRQQRIVEEASLTVTTAFNIGEQDLTRYYNANRENYQEREEADFEYIIISLDDFAAEHAPDETDISLAYEELVDSLGDISQREVRHIFISDDGEVAQERAQDIAQRAREAEANFADLVAAWSEDPGSANNGGLLGVVVRGDLPAEMDEAIFALADEEVSDPIKVDGGYSIAKINLLSAPPPSLEEAREEVEKRARRLAAEEDFNVELERLQDIAHIEVGSLLSVAVAASVSVHIALTVTRDSAQNIPPFVGAEMLEQVFANEVVNGGETSEPIALDEERQMFVNARRYQPERLRPLEEVGQEIADILRAEEQIALMLEEEEISGILSVPDDLTWRGPYTLSLTEDELTEEAPTEETEAGDDAETAEGETAQNLSAAIEDNVVNQIFISDLSEGLPAYALIAAPGRVRIFRINKTVENPARVEDLETVGELLNPAQSSVGGSAYLESLSGRYDIFFDVPEVQGTN